MSLAIPPVTVSSRNKKTLTLTSLRKSRNKSSTSSDQILWWIFKENYYSKRHIAINPPLKYSPLERRRRKPSHSWHLRCEGLPRTIALIPRSGTTTPRGHCAAAPSYPPWVSPRHMILEREHWSQKLLHWPLGNLQIFLILKKVY